MKKVVGNREVAIISDRHPALLQSVREIFGAETQAYCYRHLKENFSAFLTKHNTKGNKGKESALKWLDNTLMQGLSQITVFACINYEIIIKL